MLSCSVSQVTQLDHHWDTKEMKYNGSQPFTQYSSEALFSALWYNVKEVGAAKREVVTMASE